ncbi:4-hydroxy-tetrahydrodipicolinate reductase [Sphingobium faniae]|nr:4-hydroxy-tetrahydrodipicolinate reductase [Sphingobium faniae]
MGKVYKVIQWGAGYVGVPTLQYILMNPHLELVGVRVYTDEKDGKDAGVIASGDPIGVIATRDVDALLSLDADCVLFMPRDMMADPSIPDSPTEFWMGDLLRILESGKNVVSPIASGGHYKHLVNGEAFVERLNKACAKGNSTIFFTGFDPGFTDILAFTMSGAVGGVKAMRTWEVVDYSTYTVPETLTNMGYGRKPEDLPSNVTDVLRVTWGAVPYILGDALGVTVDELKYDADFYPAPETFTAPGGLVVEKGTIAALRFSVIGMVGGEPMLSVNHVTRIGSDMAPEWRYVGHDGGYRVELDSMPPFYGEFPLGQPGGFGTALKDAMSMTGARCVNSIEAVVNARSGYVMAPELGLLGGKYTASRK